MKISIETDSFGLKVILLLCITIVSGAGYIYNNDKKQSKTRHDHIVEQLKTQSNNTAEQFDKLHSYNREHEKQVIKINQSISALHEGMSILKSLRISQNQQ